MCYQQDIGKQFEFMQDTWANSPTFPPLKGNVGGDPIIGQVKDLAKRRQKWPRQWSKRGTTTFDFDLYVTLKGGEYFFAPSMPFLRNIV